MLNLLSKILALLPLRWAQAIGAGIARFIELIHPSYYKLLRENLANSGLFPQQAAFERAVKANISEMGKSILETFKLWETPDNEAASLVKHVYGWDVIEAGLAAKKGIIFLTPHLGCFEITSIYVAATYPVTVMYRPPRQPSLEQLIIKGRSKGLVKLAPANASGVRLLMQALKKGDAVGILPDQTPKNGEGEWADFFGKPAYTMTLACKMAEKTGAQVIMAFGKRLPKGAGYDVFFTALAAGAIATPALLNQAIETQIKQCPEQYLWRYNRYKSNRHADKKRQTASS